MKTLKLFHFFLCLLLTAAFPLTAAAQDELPTVHPVMTITSPDGEEDNSGAYDGSAPASARFEACPEQLGAYTPLYEWVFVNVETRDTFLTRYEENTDYVFQKSGTFSIKLYISFINGNDTIFYESEDGFTVTISESKLEVPNAFTPNGDGINDIFKVKDGYQSIVSFEADVFNRQGKKLYSWKELDGGWDGTFNGNDVPDGAYYLYIRARGADGKKYNIRKTINILRGFTESGSS